MKIYRVMFNDGGWHSSLPEVLEVASSEKEAIEKALEKNPRYRNGYDSFASELKIEGYVIEAYDEKSYAREKNLEKLDI